MKYLRQPLPLKRVNLCAFVDLINKPKLCGATVPPLADKNANSRARASIVQASASSRTSRRKCLTLEVDRCNNVSVRKRCFAMDHKGAQQRVSACLPNLPVAQIEMGACSLKGIRRGRSLTCHWSHYWKQRLSAAGQPPPPSTSALQRKWLQPIWLPGSPHSRNAAWTH